VAVEYSRVNPVIEAISGAARTDKIGDGNIFAFDLGQGVQIRTGDTGPDVLCAD
jgi:nitrogen regulatory protein P-II 2